MARIGTAPRTRPRRSLRRPERRGRARALGGGRARERSSRLSPWARTTSRRRTTRRPPRVSPGSACGDPSCSPSGPSSRARTRPRLLQAYSDIRHRLPEGWPLVLVGPKGGVTGSAPQLGVVAGRGHTRRRARRAVPPRPSPRLCSAGGGLTGCPRSRRWRSARRWSRARCRAPVAPRSRWIRTTPTRSPRGSCVSRSTRSCARTWFAEEGITYVRAHLVEHRPAPSRRLAGRGGAEETLRWLSSSLRLSLDVTAVPARPAGAGHYIVELARALSAREDVEPAARRTRRSDPARWRALGRAAPRGLLACRTGDRFALPGNRCASLASSTDRASTSTMARTTPCPNGPGCRWWSPCTISASSSHLAGTSAPRCWCSGARSPWPPGGPPVVDLPEPVHRRRARPMVPGRRRGGRRAPRRRHLAVPARRAGPRDRRGRPLPGRPSTRSTAGPTCSSWAPSSRARTWCSLVEAFAHVAPRHPDAVLVLGRRARMGRRTGRQRPSTPRGSARVPCAPATSPTRRCRRWSARRAVVVPGALRGLRPPRTRGARLRGTARDDCRHRDGRGRR